MDEKRIQQLIGRFLEGRTSNAEEQLLYDYFSEENVAPELTQYREMFRWYAAGMPERKAKSIMLPHLTKTARRWLAAAVSLLILIGIGLGYRSYQEQQSEYAIYEGSYIIRDGKKITDLRQILPILKATEQEVSEIMNQDNINNEIPTI